MGVLAVSSKEHGCEGCEEEEEQAEEERHVQRAEQNDGLSRQHLEWTCDAVQ